MTDRFFFVPTHGGALTPREQELLQAEARKHAAIMSHSSRKPRPPSRSQQLSFQHGLANPHRQTGLQQPNPTSSLPILNTGNPAFRVFRLRAHATGSTATITSDSQDVVHPQDQKPRIEKFQEHEDGDSSDSDAALLDDVRPLSIIIKSVLSTKPSKQIAQKHPAGFSRAIEYFIRVLVPNNAPVYAIFEVSNVNCLYFLEIIDSSGAQYLLHSVLALLHLVVGNVAPETGSSRTALKHTVAAISLLRQMISEHGNGSDDAAFVAVVCLACFSRALGDYTGYSFHRNRLLLMIKSRGGLANTGFQGFIRALTLQFAPPGCIPLSLCFNKSSGWTPPGDFDPNDLFFHDSRHLMPDPLPRPSINAGLTTNFKILPQGFRNLVSQSALSVNTVQLLCRIMNARDQKDQSQDFEPGRKHKPFGSWQPARYGDFWECCPSISRAGPDLEKYLCLSLLLYTANEFAPERVFHKGMALYGGPRELLAAEIGSLNSLQLTLAQRECWIWIWWVVIDSWSEGGKLTEKGALLMSQFWAMFPEILGWKDLQLLLERFFWGGNFEIEVRRLANAPPPLPVHTAEQVKKTK